MTSDASVGTEPLIGTVVFWRDGGSFGFVEVRGRPSSFFVDATDLVGVEQLAPGQRVRFIATAMPKGPRALAITVVASTPERR